MNQSLLQLFRIPETRGRIFATLALLAAYRLGMQIPIPGMDPGYLAKAASGQSTLFGILSAFSGSRLGDTVIFALGIMPYISASIIFSILAKVVPAIEAIQKEGQAGYKKINQWTRLAVLPIGIVQGAFIYFALFAREPGLIAPGVEAGIGLAAVVILALTAGAMVVMWLGELITEYGVGNGASLLIMANIIATMPGALSQLVSTSSESAWNTIVTLALIWCVMVAVVVYIQKGERRIPIQYARHMRGNREMQGGGAHYLPLKVNMAGVMPIVFASTVFIVPSVLFALLGWKYLESVFNDISGFVYIAFSCGLVVFFTFFWNSLMFQPEEIANNLREHNSFVPGIRPGARTADFLKNVRDRLTLAGAIFLAALSVLPNFLTKQVPGTDQRLIYFLGGTSVLIVVGVAMDMVDKMRAQLVMRSYQGFMSSGGPKWTKKG